jgi:hypothetical protein
MIYQDYINTFANYLRKERGASVVDNALYALGFGFDPTLKNGIMCACALNFPWVIYATPGYNGAGLEGNGYSTLVPVEILDDEAQAHPLLNDITAFRLVLTGFVEADAILYASALCKVVKEVQKAERQVSV